MSELLMCEHCLGVGVMQFSEEHDTYDINGNVTGFDVSEWEEQCVDCKGRGFFTIMDLLANDDD